MANDRPPLRPGGPALGRLWARWGLDPVAGAMDGVLAEWAGGRWTRLEQARHPPAALAADRCFPDCLLTPGLLDAHVHLDDSWLAGRLPGGVGFVPWLRAMIAARRALASGGPGAARAAEAQATACHAALAAALEAGTTEFWDIDALGWGRSALAEAGVPAISFREWIAPDAERWRERWKAFLASGAGVEAGEGVSPHAAYTVCPQALRDLAAWSASRRLPVAIHLAESPDERDLLVAGRGALGELLAEMGGDPVAALGIGRGAIARAHEAGLLGPATLAIHANLLEPGDAERLARSGAVVVFCPRSHRFFGYPPYPLAEHRRAGTRLALGTDGLASNPFDLDMRAEARELIARYPEIGPVEALAMTTGASLGAAPPFGGRGRLTPGAPAQWTLWQGAPAPGMHGAPPSPECLAEFWLDPATRRVRSR